MTIRLFQKNYITDTLRDIESDVYYAFEPEHNAAAIAIPRDDLGGYKGTFKVTIDWIDE
jgi:hypothetical protein